LLERIRKVGDVRRSRLQLAELISRHSRSVAYPLVEPFLRVLMVARECCGGDLDTALIMVAITLRSSRHPDFAKLEEIAADSATPLPSFGTNVRSLAESTGIPRETARRKVQQLVDAGWVVREGTTLRYSALGYHAVEPVRVAIIDMYARGCIVVDELDSGSTA
jgi:hypothetical protein